MIKRRWSDGLWLYRRESPGDAILRTPAVVLITKLTKQEMENGIAENRIADNPSIHRNPSIKLSQFLQGSGKKGFPLPTKEGSTTSSKRCFFVTRLRVLKTC